MPLLHTLSYYVMQVVVVVDKYHSCIGLLVATPLEAYIVPYSFVIASPQGKTFSSFPAQGPLSSMSKVHGVFTIGI